MATILQIIEGILHTRKSKEHIDHTKTQHQKWSVSKSAVHKDELGQNESQVQSINNTRAQGPVRSYAATAYKGVEEAQNTGEIDIIIKKTTSAKNKDGDC